MKLFNRNLLAGICLFAAIGLCATLLVPDTHAVTYNPNTAATPSQSYKNIATNTTTTAKSSAGVLDSIIVNTAGASANTITVYDNTAGSGTKIATIDGTIAAGTKITYNVAFGTGLTVVTATGTCANITVAYR